MATAGLAMVSCSSGSSEPAATTTTAATTTKVPAGAAPDQMTDAALVASCDAELTSVKTAVAAYEAMEGAPPPDVQALVGGYLDELPKHAKIQPDGSVVLTGECA